MASRTKRDRVPTALETSDCPPHVFVQVEGTLFKCAKCTATAHFPIFFEDTPVGRRGRNVSARGGKKGLGTKKPGSGGKGNGHWDAKGFEYASL